VDADTLLAEKLRSVRPYLNERQWRLVLAAEARALGHGGIARVARVAATSRPTIQLGLRELAGAVTVPERVRQPGGGRPKLSVRDPALLSALEALVDPDTRGDPMSPLRWTCKSTRQLADALRQGGHRVGYRTVAALLGEAGYSLQAPVKRLEGGQHPDRDAQFRYLNEQVTAFLAADQPVVSVDAKKKELVGAFKNGGREWQPQGQPEAVNVHDFVDKRRGKAIPYGIYDVGRNTGWVTVGQDHDTASFAVASLRRWWQVVGSAAYPGAERLLVSADGGGSNGYRVRLWKVDLQRFADETGLEVTVCHLPPRDEQVEQDRASAVRPHQHQLARSLAGQPRGHRGADRRDHDPRRLADPSGTRPRPIPDQGQSIGRGDGPPPHHSARVPRRLELYLRPARPCRCVRVILARALRGRSPHGQTGSIPVATTFDHLLG